ncbi:MAG: ribonuclease domain-containing protein [Solirubrobacteraceae bacterium]
MTGRWSRRRAGVAVLLAALALAGCGESEPTTADTGPPTVRLSALPPEAHATIRLIRAGGPFPHRQDGATFQNRERRLPDRPTGTYREYTVRTPSTPTRGARRLVVARGGPTYYTADHYRTFRRVVQVR